MIIIPEYLAIHEPDEKLLDIINKKTFNDIVLFEKKSDFHNIKVVENEVGRFIHYKDTYQAGFINTQFYKGNLPYINYFTIPYLVNPDIRNILLIGFGTGKIVKDFEKLFDSLEFIDIVDIEENIFDIAKDFFDFKKSDKMQFYLQDGIVYLRENKKKYDLIVVDVASDDGIDDRFLSQEYIDLVKKSLSEKGLFVSNLCSSPDFENPENTFFKAIYELYNNNFKKVAFFKGNESDRVYYKSFFDIDSRVIDITNVIILSSKSNFSFSKNFNRFKIINVDIGNYMADLYII